MAIIPSPSAKILDCFEDFVQEFTSSKNYLSFQKSAFAYRLSSNNSIYYENKTQKDNNEEVLLPAKEVMDYFLDFIVNSN